MSLQQQELVTGDKSQTPSQHHSHRIPSTRTSSFRRHRHSNMMNIFRWSLFHLALAWQLNTVLGCTEVYDDYSNLVAALEEGQTFGSAFICPFTIQGSLCPRTDQSSTISVTAPFFIIVCANFGGGTGDACVIDCPHTHFEVLDGASLVLESMTLSGAVNTSTVVRDGARLDASYSLYEGNMGGGAIRVEPNGALTLQYTDFVENSGSQGGAIYNQGDMFITGGNFVNNKADGNGGAIYSDGFTSDLSDAGFRSNLAGGEGPAVYSTHAFSGGGNEGCGNQNNIGDICDGIFEEANDGCEEFAFQCTMAPTQGPTRAPSAFPTPTPSASPTETRGPSTIPTNPPTWTTVPSVAPSVSPTTAPKPSAMPSSSPTQSRSPSSLPSFSPTETQSPSATPTQIPTLYPTISHSTPPSISHAPTGLPTPVPTAAPSWLPTLVPTASHAPSGLPTPTPSGSHSPSGVPTLTSTIQPSSTPTILLPTVMPTFGPTPEPSGK